MVLPDKVVIADLFASSVLWDLSTTGALRGPVRGSLPRATGRLDTVETAQEDSGHCVWERVLPRASRTG